MAADPRARTIRDGTLAGGPLAHRVEQGTFNPKVAGSRPARPTWKLPAWKLRLLISRASDATRRIQRIRSDQPGVAEPLRSGCGNDIGTLLAGNFACILEPSPGLPSPPVHTS